MYLQPSRRSSVRVTAGIPGGDSRTIIFLYNDASKIQAGEPRVEIIGNQRRTGAQGGRLEEHLEVRVRDGAGTLLREVAIQFDDGASGMFLPVEGTDVYVDDSAFAGTLADPMNADTVRATSNSPAPKGTPVFVKTNTSGVAKIHYQLADSASSATVTASIVGATPSEYAEFIITGLAENTTANLEVVSGNSQSAAKGTRLANPLVVIARSTAGYRIPGVIIQFRTVTGELRRSPGTQKPSEVDAGLTSAMDNPDSGHQIYVETGVDGQASVNYNVGQLTVARDVVAEVRREAGTNQYDFAIRQVVFNVNGRAGTGDGTAPAPAPATNTITISPSTLTGEPGEEVTINVTASLSNVFVTLGSNEFGATRFSPQSGLTPLTSTLLLPVEEGTHSFFATSGALNDTASVTVESELGTLSITAIGTPDAGAQTFSISAVDADGDRAIGVFTATLRGTGFTSRNVEISGGSGNARVTLPTAAGLYTLTVRATGYEDGPTSVRIAAGGQVDDTDDDPADDTADDPADDTALQCQIVSALSVHLDAVAR